MLDDLDACPHVKSQIKSLDFVVYFLVKVFNTGDIKIVSAHIIFIIKSFCL